MRSDLVFGAVTHLNNRYILCQLASKATRKFHRPNTRVQETMNDVLTRLSTTLGGSLPARKEMAAEPERRAA